MKYVLITGAGGGMGLATAHRLKDAGYTVFALDRREVTCEEGIIPVVADVTDEQSVISAFRAVSEYTDTLYAIIHFAGIYMLDSLVEMKSEDFDRIFKINLTGAFLINKHFLPLLKSGSRILITTSELADLDPLPFTGIYAITKAALDKYAYSLCMEMQLLGIHVSVLRCGAVETDMIGASVSALERFVENTSLYSCNAKRFKEIVDSVEARAISRDKVADKAEKIIKKKKPAYAYSINRNPLLRLLSLLPKGLQLWIIKGILKK